MWSIAAVTVTLWVAQAPAKENPYLAQARTLYQALEYERCVQRLDAALKADVETSEVAQIQLYQGLCKHGMGRKHEAENHFRLALRLDPKITPPQWVSPTVTRLFEDVRAELPAPVVEDAPKQVVLTPAPTPEVKAPTPEVVVSPRSRVLPIAFTGGAVVAAGTGVFFGLRAQSLEQEFRREEFEAPSIALSRDAKQAALAANVSYIVSAGLAIAAGVLWAVNTGP